MPEQRRQRIEYTFLWGLTALTMILLTACAGPGGEGFATLNAGGTAGKGATTATASAGSTSASTSATASRTAAVGSSASSPNAVGSVAVRTPGAASSVSASPVSGSQPAGVGSVAAGSAASGTRPATSGSTTPGAAGSATRPTTTTGSAAAGSAGAGVTGTTSASTATAVIPPPPNGMAYVQGTNATVDSILKIVGEGVASSLDSVTVTSSKNYLSASSAADVVAFYRAQMPILGWKPEQGQDSSNATALTFSRDNQMNAALIFVVDLAQLNQKGSLVIAILATPK